MKYFYLIIIFFLSVIGLKGQVTDTIEVSYTKTAYLIFPEAPEVDKGSEDVIIRIYKNKVIIQAAVEGFEETNLFVQSGAKMYMFILIYKQHPKNYVFNYQVRRNTLEVDNTVKKSLEIVTLLEKPKKPKGKKGEMVSIYDDEKISETPKTNELIDYQVKKSQTEKLSKENLFKTEHKANCMWVDSKSQNIFNKGAIKDKINFIATNFYVNDSFFYLKLYIINKSKIKYDIDFIRFTIKSVKKGIKKAADQYIEINPVYVFNKRIKSISGKNKDYFIYVFDKFTIENNKRFNIEMWEENGDRKLNFDFFYDDILKITSID